MHSWRVAVSDRIGIRFSWDKDMNSENDRLHALCVWDIDKGSTERRPGSVVHRRLC